MKAQNRAHGLARYEEVVALRERGIAKRQIGERVGLDRRTLSLWLSAGSFPERKERAPTGRHLEPFYSSLEERFADGCHNAAALSREVQARGVRGGSTLVGQCVLRLRRGSPPVRTPQVRRPTARRCAGWLSASEERLMAEPRDFVDRLSDLSPDLSRMRALAQEFRRMLLERDVNAIGPWLRSARHRLLRGFAEGVHADVRAVRGATLLPWSNGPVEGQVNRLKMIKR